MHVLRPVRPSDLPGLMTLARSIVGGMTSLPPVENFLGERIDESLRAFSPLVKRPGGEYYLFVLEDLESGEIVGTSGIASRVGGFDPFYSYEVREERFTHAPLGIDKAVRVLHLRHSHKGPSEIGALFLREDRRRGGLGRLLSLGRFLFLGAWPARFTDTVIAEMRGYLDQRGKSPFWEAVGRHFFEHDFYTADLLSGLGNKAFIADLMPRHPIYLPLLPPEVQAVVGKVHHQAEPALAMLRAEGFAGTTEVDIFDAGPQVRAQVDQLRTVRARRTLPVAGLAPEPGPGPAVLVCADRLDFRATVAPVREVADGAILDAATARALSPEEPLRQVTVAPLA